MSDRDPFRERSRALFSEPESEIDRVFGGGPGALGEPEPEPEPEPDLEQSEPQSVLRTLVELVGVLGGALVFAFLLKAFVVQAYHIPSESMSDTLEINDRVLVDKLSYRFRDIKRGDVVVFACPPAATCTTDDFIKRVVAFPGETIRFVDGEVRIDDSRLSEPYVDAPTAPAPTTLVSQGCSETPVVDRCTLAEGWVFVMGDNRYNSIDSRWFGPIREESVVGRAFLKMWPLSNLEFL